MKMKLMLLAITILIETIHPASAMALAAKVGYFNLALVKASAPETAASYPMTAESERKLLEEIEEGNKTLKQMWERHESKESIASYQNVLQTKINDDHKKLMLEVRSNNLPTSERIKKAIRTVAASRGLDLTLDSASVFQGGAKIVDGGIDITNDIIACLAGKELGSSRSVNQIQLNLGYFDGALIRSQVPAIKQMEAAMGNRKIGQGIEEVAKSKGLDFVLEGSGVNDGGALVLTKGVDITNDLVSLLSKDGK